MLNKSKVAAIDNDDSATDRGLNAKLFELSQRHRLKTTVFLVAAMAVLTWGFTIQQTNVVRAELADSSQTLTLSQQ
jgi:hypothetical protein